MDAGDNLRGNRLLLNCSEVGDGELIKVEDIGVFGDLISGVFGRGERTPLVSTKLVGHFLDRRQS